MLKKFGNKACDEEFEIKWLLSFESNLVKNDRLWHDDHITHFQAEMWVSHVQLIKYSKISESTTSKAKIKSKEIFIS